MNSWSALLIHPLSHPETAAGFLDLDFEWHSSFDFDDLAGAWFIASIVFQPGRGASDKDRCGH